MSDARQSTPGIQARAHVERSLLRHCRGRENAIHSSTLAMHIPVEASFVAAIIDDLRDDPSAPPVAACDEGYYLIETTAELAARVAQMHDDIAATRERIETTVQSFEHDIGLRGDSDE